MNGPDELVERLLVALDVAARALLASGDATRPDGGTDGAHPEILPLVPAKVLGECTLLIRSASSVAGRDERIAAATDRLAALATPLARDDATLAAMALDPARVLDHGFAHVLLGAAGYPDVRVDRLVGECLALSPGCERLPTREAEQRWLLRLWSGRPADDEAAVLAFSPLAHPLDALRATAAEHYSFTHLILYATDMGLGRALLPRPPADVLADADTALAAALDADNLDLTAELLWTWPMLGAPWSATASFAVALLADAFDEHGFLPGPAHSARHMLRSSYHTTLVYGILCAAMLRRPLPAPVPSGTRAVPTPPPRGARWERVIRDEDDLDPLLLAITLRRAAANFDLATTRDVLTAAVDADLAGAPAPVQAAALLRRSAALAGVV